MKQLLDLAAGEEPQMRAVEQPGRFVRPVPLQERPDDAVVPHVGDAGDQAAVRGQPLAGLGQQPARLAQVLEHVGADDRIERTGRNLQVELLDVARPDLVQPLPRRGGGIRVEFDTRDLGLLPLLDRFAQPPRAAADVEHAPRGLRERAPIPRAGHARSKTDRVRLRLAAVGRPAVRVRRGRETGADGETCGPGCGVVGRPARRGDLRSGVRRGRETSAERGDLRSRVRRGRETSAERGDLRSGLRRGRETSAERLWGDLRSGMRRGRETSAQTGRSCGPGCGVVGRPAPERGDLRSGVRRGRETSRRTVVGRPAVPGAAWSGDQRRTGRPAVPGAAWSGDQRRTVVGRPAVRDAAWSGDHAPSGCGETCGPGCGVVGRPAPSGGGETCGPGCGVVGRPAPTDVELAARDRLSGRTVHSVPRAEPGFATTPTSTPLSTCSIRWV